MWKFLAGLAVAVSVSGGADAASAVRSSFGTGRDGQPVEAITLTNGHGMTVRVISWGAILQSVSVPDRQGRSADIALGYADMRGYLARPNFFGATVGRYANRIRAGSFTLDGKVYKLALNDGPNALHGGRVGFDKRLWTVDEVAGGATAHVTLSYTSVDGEEGYPGTLKVKATYSLDERNELRLEYVATTDQPTVVNITNHSFFNLGGEASQRSILDYRLTIAAEATTPVDRTLIPTGERRPVANTPFDFRTPHVIGERIRDGSDQQIAFGQGYDENFIVGSGVAAQPQLNARLEDPVSGRIMEIMSNQPGLQLYTGNFLNATAFGKSNHAYRQSDGIAMEPQAHPDTPNQPAFGSAVLRPGAVYRNTIIYRFSVARR